MGNLIIMNEELKAEALEALRTFPNVSITDVANILECVQQCYVRVEGNSPCAEFLVNELQFFISNLRNGEFNLQMQSNSNLEN